VSGISVFAITGDTNRKEKIVAQTTNFFMVVIFLSVVVFPKTRPMEGPELRLTSVDG